MHGLRVILILHCIQVDENCRSEYRLVKCVVPQGSILGLLLF